MRIIVLKWSLVKPTTMRKCYLLDLADRWIDDCLRLVKFFENLGYLVDWLRDHRF